MKMTKPCRRCGVEKGIDGFGPSAQGALGMRAICKVCRQAEAKARRLDPAYKRRQKLAQVKYQYGITPGQYEEMERRQEGRCAMCNRFPHGGMLAVDHDHRCCPQARKACGGCVRGLLCQRCNGFLALFEDAELRDAALAYLDPTFDEDEAHAAALIYE